MSALPAVIAEYQRRLESVGRRAAAELGGRVVTRTPVDTGLARQSWTPARNRVDGSNAGGDIAATANALALGDTFTLTNAQPYIRVLEYDAHSAQAPSGMVRVSVAEWRAIVREALRGV